MDRNFSLTWQLICHWMSDKMYNVHLKWLAASMVLNGASPVSFFLPIP